MVNNGQTATTTTPSATGTLAIGPVAGSAVTIGNGTTLTVGSAINNQGTLTLGATTSNTDLRINRTTVTLTGGGTVALTNSANNLIRDVTGFSDGVLVNVNNTIAGSGSLGAGSLSIQNQAGGHDHRPISPLR